MSRMSVESRYQETPTEMTTSMITKRTSHEASNVMKDTMTRQIWGTYSRSYGTGENYRTQELDQTSVWKDVCRKVEMSRDDPETIDAPTHTQVNDSDICSVPTGIVTLSISLHSEGPMTESAGIDAALLSDSSSETEIPETLPSLLDTPGNDLLQTHQQPGGGGSCGSRSTWDYKSLSHCPRYSG